MAERLAARLGERGGRVEVQPITDVDDVGGYDAVVLGSGVYNQRWIPSATEFVRDNAALLAARQVWLFSVGSFGDTHRGIDTLMKREPKETASSNIRSTRASTGFFRGTVGQDHGRAVGSNPGRLPTRLTGL